MDDLNTRHLRFDTEPRDLVAVMNRPKDFEIARDEGDEFVDRLYHAPREDGLGPERRYPLREAGAEYIVTLAMRCRQGVAVVDITGSESRLPYALRLAPDTVVTDPHGYLRDIRSEVDRRGGVLPYPQEGRKGIRA
jgi:hypothetical protein